MVKYTVYNSFFTEESFRNRWLSKALCQRSKNGLEARNVKEHRLFYRLVISST